MSQEPTPSAQSWSANIDASGRILIPAELRNLLNVAPGDSLTWVKNESGVQLKRFEETIREIQAYYCSLSPPEDVWSEEIIEQRRIEAANEAGDD